MHINVPNHKFPNLKKSPLLRPLNPPPLRLSKSLMGGGIPGGPRGPMCLDFRAFLAMGYISTLSSGGNIRHSVSPQRGSTSCEMKINYQTWNYMYIYNVEFVLVCLFNCWLMTQETSQSHMWYAAESLTCQAPVHWRSRILSSGTKIEVFDIIATQFPKSLDLWARSKCW